MAVRLLLFKEDGSQVNAQLLRPRDKVEVKAGDFAQFDMPELGITEMALVLEVRENPPIKPGKGRIVTGTYAHRAANVIDVYLKDLDEPIGTTDNHPFWSQDRQDYVPAGDLIPGETLLRADGSTAHVKEISPRGPPEPVYNIEVEGDHVYYVSDQNVLVHNAKTCILTTTGVARAKYFDDWIEGLSDKQFNRLWKNKRSKRAILNRLRTFEGKRGLHEYLMVSRADVWRKWFNKRFSMDDFRKYQIEIKKLNKMLKGKVVHNNGHMSKTLHNELDEIISNSKNFSQFKKGLNDWAGNWLKKGAADLPS